MLFELLFCFEVDDYAVRVAVSLRAGRPSCSRRTRFSPWRRRISARRRVVVGLSVRLPEYASCSSNKYPIVVPRIFTKISRLLIFVSPPFKMLSNVILENPHFLAICVLLNLLSSTSCCNFLVFMTLCVYMSSILYF